MNRDSELINAIALSHANYFSLTGLIELYQRLGSASAVMEHRHDIREVLPDASPRLVETLRMMDDYLKLAEEELNYDKAHGIEVITYNDANYPQRLKECPDAPLVLFYKGSADLNSRRVISIVGTRRITVYGQDIIRRFLSDLSRMCPDTVVVSGLAYGVDYNAHKNALDNGLSTVGVLAHGLDMIYPAAHRELANRMIPYGGVLTEYMTHTRPLSKNFVQRNRIVAGVSDAVILVESASKGGGLITANIANSYSREVFAFPGAVGAEYSEGCNHLIRDHSAELITSAEDFVKFMGWESDAMLLKAKQKGIERDMFPDLSEEEKLIVDTLRKHNDLQINMLTVQTGIAIPTLTSLLFKLEMKGIVKQYAGGMFHLLS